MMKLSISAFTYFSTVLVSTFRPAHQIDGKDLFLCDSLLSQIILIDLQERRLAAAAHAGDDFDELFVPEYRQFVEIFFSLDSLYRHNQSLLGIF